MHTSSWLHSDTLQWNLKSELQLEDIQLQRECFVVLSSKKVIVSVNPDALWIVQQLWPKF